MSTKSEALAREVTGIADDMERDLKLMRAVVKSLRTAALHDDFASRVRHHESRVKNLRAWAASQ